MIVYRFDPNLGNWFHGEQQVNVPEDITQMAKTADEEAINRQTSCVVTLEVADSSTTMVVKVKREPDYRRPVRHIRIMRLR